jgi:hypothetical protein
MSKNIQVKILSEGYIPFVNAYGPILSPVFMSEEQYNILTNIGFRVEKINIEENEIKKETIVQEEVVQEEVVQEEVVQEEVVQEEVVQEEVVQNKLNDENLSGDSVYTYEFLTKKRCMTILDNRGIEYDKESFAEPLKKIVLETNPK